METSFHKGVTMSRVLNSRIIYYFLGISFLGFLMWRFPHVIDSSENRMYLTRSILVLSLLIPTVFHLGLARALKYGAAWGGICFIVIVSHSYKEELNSMLTRVKAQLLPFSATANTDGSVTFIRANDGHFHIEALVNGTPIHFMVDTGATRTTLTPQDAQRLGIDPDTLSYNQLVNTANGEAFTASVRLFKIKVGPIVLDDIGASVSKNMSGPSLLGMNFLNKMKGFKVEGERLTVWG